MTLSKCDNCADGFAPEVEGLLLTTGGKCVAAICARCCKDVRVAKLVIKKPDVGSFAYEQWSPMEMSTSGLSSDKRAG